MRLHHLRLTAFGPFAATVDVDLDALSASGLFLLHGETGAGKTTLLDGIGFALYGRVPGQRGDAKHLRSDHADAADRTVVRLEVTLCGRRMRITRHPAQDKPSNRGGTTTVQASVLLEELVEADWRPLSTRMDEAGAEILDLMGMSAEQFFQVVLLPQGDFARFLKADSKDRGAVLQKLFATDRFRAVEDHLAELRRSTESQRVPAHQEVRRLTACVAQAAGVAGAQDAEVDLTGPQGASAGLDAAAGPLDVSWATGLHAAARTDAEQAAAGAGAQRLARDAHRSAAEAANRLADLQARRAAALDTAAALERSRPEIELLRAELTAAVGAAQVAGPRSEVQSRQAACTDARAAQQAARSDLQAVVGRHPALIGLLTGDDRPSAAGAQGHRLDGDGVVTGAAADAGPDPVDGTCGVSGAAAPVLRVIADAARARHGFLQGLRETEAAILVDQTARRQAETEARSAADAAASGAQALAALPARRQTLTARVAAAQAASIELPTVRARCQSLTIALVTVTQLAQMRALEVALRERHLVARETSVSLRERELELRRARFDSMVAELASHLATDTPCPVCGSLDHPDPSALDDERVTREDEERAREDAEAADRQMQDVFGQLSAATATITQLSTTLATAGHQADAAPLRAELLQAEADIRRLSILVDDLPAAGAQLDDLEREAAERATAQTTTLADEVAARRRATDAQERVERAIVNLAAQLAGAVDLDAAMAEASSFALHCELTMEADEAGRRAEQELSLAVVRAESAALIAGFTDLPAASEADRAASWREDAQARLSSHGEQLARVSAVLDDPALAVVLDPPADVSGTAAALRQADAELAEREGHLATTRQRLLELEALVPAFVTALGALTPLEERCAEVRRLADLCAGGGANTLKMTLSSFVLAARLEEVADAASARLLKMTQGRFSLHHTVDGRGSARAGLGLMVRDAWNGGERQTGTLSGGETFLASLSLALGLADVVTAEAGGTRIEALFVDEGFGTLDADTLDEVMDVLDGLREGGRVVGLVSHVAELRTRVPAQVHVRKGRSGSEVELSGC